MERRSQKQKRTACSCYDREETDAWVQLLTSFISEFGDLVSRIKTCTLCSLSQKRTNAVPGEGSRKAEILFIGEGPGYYEDRDGRPFVGPAGQFLEKLLASIGLRRDDVYITNMVKCRPPNNRDPLPNEIHACQPYLDSQIEMISPKVVVTLGRYSFSKFFPGETIGKARGTPRSWRKMTLYPMYHPAAALHNPKLRQVIESDFRKLPSLVEEASRIPEQEEAAQAQQLSLF